MNKLKLKGIPLYKINKSIIKNFNNIFNVNLNNFSDNYKENINNLLSDFEKLKLRNLIYFLIKRKDKHSYC